MTDDDTDHHHNDKIIMPFDQTHHPMTVMRIAEAP